MIGYLKRFQKCTSTSSKQCRSTQDPKLQHLSNPSLLLRTSYSLGIRKKASNDDDNVQGTRASTKKDNEPVADEKIDYVICHVSFQPTGGTNIMPVNALSLVEL